MNFYKYGDGSTHKPTDSTQLATWTHKDYTVKAGIMSFRSVDFIYLTSDASTAQDAWKVVGDHWDVRNSYTLYHAVQASFSTKMKNTDVLTYHIYSYEHQYTYTMEGCRNTDD